MSRKRNQPSGAPSITKPSDLRPRADALLYPVLTTERLHLVPPRQPLSRGNPLVLWHLLSLDAPTVAALWTWFIARVNHVELPASSIVAMAVAVWLLYAADRLLDARLLDKDTEEELPLEARHRFHYRYRRAFLIGIALAAITLAVLLPGLAPEAIHLYLIEGSFLIGYFVLIHATASSYNLRVPKELAVGLFFAAAIFIPTIAREAALRLPLLWPAILLSALCSLNCLYIYAWEHPLSTHSDAHLATRLALAQLHILTAVLMIASIATAIFSQQTIGKIPTAIALSTTTLALLHRYRHKLGATTLRAAADLALLTPLVLLIPF